MTDNYLVYKFSSVKKRLVSSRSKESGEQGSKEKEGTGEAPAPTVTKARWHPMGWFTRVKWVTEIVPVDQGAKNKKRKKEKRGSEE